MDAAAQDPAADYWAVREELRMYNPEYVRVLTSRSMRTRHVQVAKPHVVALNKMDLEDAHVLQDDIRADIQRIASSLAVRFTSVRKHRDVCSSQEQHAEMEGAQWQPLAIVACSAVSGDGLDQLRTAMEDMLRSEQW